MAKCNQVTPLPFKRLSEIVHTPSRAGDDGNEAGEVLPLPLCCSESGRQLRCGLRLIGR